MFASATPCGDSVFFAFSAASNNFMRGFGELMGSHLCFARNSAAIHSATLRSKSRPPRVRSYVVDFTVNFPMT